MDSNREKPHANNNRIKKLNQTIRARTRLQRGWKSDDFCPERRQRLCNFIRENQGLNGATPAEMAGLYQASGENRWLELLGRSLTTEGKRPFKPRT